MPVTVLHTYQCNRITGSWTTSANEPGASQQPGKEGQEFHPFRTSGKRIQLPEQVDRKLTTNVGG